MVDWMLNYDFTPVRVDNLCHVEPYLIELQGCLDERMRRAIGCTNAIGIGGVEKDPWACSGFLHVQRREWVAGPRDEDSYAQSQSSQPLDPLKNSGK